MTQPITESEIHAQLVRWCKAVTGRKTIQSYPGADRPSGEYCEVEFLTGPRDVRTLVADIEFNETGENNSEGNPQIEAVPVIESEWKFSIKSYRGEVMDPIRKMRSRSKMQGPQLELHELLTIHDMGIPNSTPEMINNEWEPRAHTLIFIRGYTRDGFLIDVIDDAPVTVTTNFND